MNERTYKSSGGTMDFHFSPLALFFRPSPSFLRNLVFFFLYIYFFHCNSFADFWFVELVSTFAILFN